MTKDEKDFLGNLLSRIGIYYLVYTDTINLIYGNVFGYSIRVVQGKKTDKTYNTFSEVLCFLIQENYIVEEDALLYRLSI